MRHTSAEHLGYAHEHFKEADLLLRGHKPRWATVALFYAALHMVHAALQELPGIPDEDRYPENHGGTAPGGLGTNVLVKKHAPKIDLAYRELFDASIDVRYEGGQMAEEVAQMHRYVHLAAVATWTCEILHADIPRCGCWLRGV